MLRSGDPKSEARFAREIRALGRVDHPNVVKAFTSGSHGDQWFYAMELVEGADLGRVCELLAESAATEGGVPEWQQAVSTACDEARQNEEPITQDGERAQNLVSVHETSLSRSTGINRLDHITQIVDVVRQVADGAHALHEAGVVHRDIKPSNVLVTPDGRRAVLMDLGLAQLADETGAGRQRSVLQPVDHLGQGAPRADQKGHDGSPCGAGRVRWGAGGGGAAVTTTFSRDGVIHTPPVCFRA
jgi:serine/threonine protein kinase